MPISKTAPDAPATIRRRPKEEQLLPRVMACIDRLQRFIELGAPAIIVGHAAWSLYATVLACYGPEAGEGMVASIRDGNLHSRGMCNNDDCTNRVGRPGLGVCADCVRKLGIVDVDLELDSDIT